MERGKRWELAQREINKKDNTKLTPHTVDPREIYYNVMPVMFARFVCALLIFFARNFPTKIRNPRTQESHRGMQLVKEKI